jgi:hypothetical protein
VLVPARFAANRRRPIALVAIWLAVWLVVVQAFLAGVVAAQAGARLAQVPRDILSGDVICHASGDAGQADGSVPDTGNGWHLCCAACTAPALATPATPALGAMELPRAFQRLTLPRLTIVVARGAIRAGPSQGPPTLA